MGEIMTVIEGTKRFSVNDSNLVLADNQDVDIFRIDVFGRGKNSIFWFT